MGVAGGGLAVLGARWTAGAQGATPVASPGSDEAGEPIGSVGADAVGGEAATELFVQRFESGSFAPKPGVGRDERCGWSSARWVLTRRRARFSWINRGAFPDPLWPGLELLALPLGNGWDSGRVARAGDAKVPGTAKAHLARLGRLLYDEKTYT
jgi:hypothetical protein